MNVHPRREHVGIPRQRQRGQVAAVGAAVNPDPIRIDAGLRAEKGGRRLNVAILSGTARAGVRWLMEVVSIADAQPVVHGQNDEPAARQILIERIGVGVIVRVVPPQQHLPRRTTVDVDDRGLPRAPATGGGGLEQLPVNSQPIG